MKDAHLAAYRCQFGRRSVRSWTKLPLTDSETIIEILNVTAKNIATEKL
jgi:hypothetical protein